MKIWNINLEFKKSRASVHNNAVFGRDSQELFVHQKSRTRCPKVWRRSSVNCWHDAAFFLEEKIWVVPRHLQCLMGSIAP